MWRAFFSLLDRGHGHSITLSPCLLRRSHTISIGRRVTPLTSCPPRSTRTSHSAATLSHSSRTTLTHCRRIKNHLLTDHIPNYSSLYSLSLVVSSHHRTHSVTTRSPPNPTLSRCSPSSSPFSLSVSRHHLPPTLLAHTTVAVGAVAQQETDSAASSAETSIPDDGQGADPSPSGAEGGAEGAPTGSATDAAGAEESGAAAGEESAAGGDASASPASDEAGAASTPGAGAGGAGASAASAPGAGASSAGGAGAGASGAGASSAGGAAGAGSSASARPSSVGGAAGASGSSKVSPPP